MRFFSVFFLLATQSLDIFHDIFPGIFFTIDIISCMFSAKFLRRKFSLKRDVCLFVTNNLKAKRKKYSTNYCLMPDHFDVLLTFNSST